MYLFLFLSRKSPVNLCVCVGGGGEVLPLIAYVKRLHPKRTFSRLWVYERARKAVILACKEAQYG